MILYPAIDLRAGSCVRLMHGRFDQITQYDSDPLSRARAFHTDGARWVHIVDLDGAEAGRPVQHDLIGRIARNTPLNVQSGGGVRSAEHIEALLQAGVDRVVVGSLATTRPHRVLDWLQRFGADKLTLAFDVKAEAGRFMPALKGWVESATTDLWSVLDAYPAGALTHVLITDISRDGALTGSNLELMKEVIARRPDLQIQASGGVAGLEDLTSLRETGCAGVIVGRALYEGRFGLKEAVDEARA